MKFKVILIVDLDHMSFQYLIDTFSLLYWNNIKNNLAIGDWMKNVEWYHNN